MRFPLILVCLTFIACNYENRPVSRSSEDTSEIKQSQIVEPFSSQNNLISCWAVGEIELGDDLAAIEEKVGRSQVSQDSLFLEGNFERLFTTLWKKSDRELKIHWQETTPPFKTIKYIELDQPASVYAFGNGIRIGMDLKDLVKLNENRPIHFYGFGWDYGGTFIDFGNGKLRGDLPCFGGVFNLEEESVNQESSNILGDHKLSSDHPDLKNRKVRLTVIRVRNVN